jgi:hypothetical protein
MDFFEKKPEKTSTFRPSTNRIFAVALHRQKQERGKKFAVVFWYMPVVQYGG